MDVPINKPWLSFLTERHISKDMDQIQKLRVRLMNQFVFVIISLMLTNAVWLLHMRDYGDFLILLGISMLLLVVSLCTRICMSEKIGLYIYICSTILIFYFSTETPVYTTLSRFYFTLLFAALFIFPEKFRTANIFIYLWILTCYYLVKYYRDGGFSSEDTGETVNYPWEGRFQLLTLCLWMVKGYFIILKKERLKKLTQESIKNVQYLQENSLVSASKIAAQTEDKQVDKAIAHNNSDSMVQAVQHTVTDLVEMAKADDLAFIPAFKQAYPNFYDSLLKINPDLTNQEFKFCALLKLGFSTKDISNYNHLAVRSVQTKKSRLRKSLNIPREEDLYQWIDRL